MEILLEHVNGIDVLKLKGRLDASSAEDMKEQVSALARDKCVNLVIDMDAIEFVDSSGLGCIAFSRSLMTALLPQEVSIELPVR